MNSEDCSTEMIFALLRAGLWQTDVLSLDIENIDLERVCRIAEEQTVEGLILAGYEKLQKDLRKAGREIPLSDEILELIGIVHIQEQLNKEMNRFIGKLVQKMRSAGVYSLLVKGQGIAQCYEKPQWRTCGDVDLLLDEDNYRKAFSLLSSMVSHVEDEIPNRLHREMEIGGWSVELHGTLRSGLWKRLDKCIDEIQTDTFKNKAVRIWDNNGVEVLLPAPDNDVIFVFTHILQHFFKLGIGLRQICDWCRLLWTYQKSLDTVLLESRLRKMGLMTEWLSFAALAVDRLGMPEKAMPLYSKDKRWKRKANRLVNYILMTGNFGHNCDDSYRTKYTRLFSKAITLCRITKALVSILPIFPKDALKAWCGIVMDRLNGFIKGK